MAAASRHSWLTTKRPGSPTISANSYEMQPGSSRTRFWVSFRSSSSSARRPSRVWIWPTTTTRPVVGGSPVMRPYGYRMTRSFVVTGGARGIGRAVAERLAEDGHVVAFDLDEAALAWARDDPRVTAVAG